MKRIIITAMACGVWLSGVTSAAALTYVLDRPVSPPSTSAMTQATQALRGLGDPGNVLVSEDTSVKIERMTPSSPAHPVQPVTLPPPSPRDIDEMTCAGWRDLDMGSGHVQVCE
jgi:hypothetical protein